jgi:protein-disulfide isomerase
MNNYNFNNEIINDEPKNNNVRRYLIPVAIVIVGITIAGVIIGTRATEKNNENISNQTQAQVEFVPGSPENVRPINASDHILGNPNAPIKIIEFSDFECPFCKVLHSVMINIMDTYGKDGKVVWIYRHFPIDSIHSKARKEAIAAECAGEIGGNNSFWDYSNRIFEITPSNDKLDLSLLPEIAEYVGVEKDAFIKCLESGRYDEHIESDFNDAISSGANGTPYSVIIAPNGKTFPISGSQTYSTVSSIVDLALKERR